MRTITTIIMMAEMPDAEDCEYQYTEGLQFFANLFSFWKTNRLRNMNYQNNHSLHLHHHHHGICCIMRKGRAMY
jgi:hypothetical protein